MTAISPIAISLNFDSLSEAYGFPDGYKDPTFFGGFDRVADLAAQYDFPLSCYMIGRDLENLSHANRVRQWHEQGHEIGNHTYSHHYNLGALSREAIYDEISQAHKQIALITGESPKGFIAPAWSSSSVVNEVLMELGYRYDSSSFPSIYLYPLIFKSLLSHIGDLQKGVRILGRKDWLSPLIGDLQPHVVRGGGDNKQLLVMPLPVMRRWQICRWHTAGFFLGWDAHYAAIEKLAAEHEGFYYVIHPADFLGPEDLSGAHTQRLERMDIALDEKMRRLKDVFDILKACGRPMKTMAQKAEALMPA